MNQYRLWFVVAVCSGVLSCTHGGGSSPKDEPQGKRFKVTSSVRIYPALRDMVSKVSKSELHFFVGNGLNPVSKKMESGVALTGKKFGSGKMIPEADYQFFTLDAAQNVLKLDGKAVGATSKYKVATDAAAGGSDVWLSSLCTDDFDQVCTLNFDDAKQRFVVQLKQKK